MSMSETTWQEPSLEESMKLFRSIRVKENRKNKAILERLNNPYTRSENVEEWLTVTCKTMQSWIREESSEMNKGSGAYTDQNLLSLWLLSQLMNQLDDVLEDMVVTTFQAGASKSNIARATGVDAANVARKFKKLNNLKETTTTNK